MGPNLSPRHIEEPLRTGSRQVDELSIEMDTLIEVNCTKEGI